ncbi:hypothetical protein CEXT_336991 [Caerostris extrusa]|uniref:Uncharacterized protein n=1 Tax=Caerostris extrusa TaxID=172846 RepID=A0AAV4XTU9_CAEEX|nr:hypothetical protein CEXT_336991 [Caerostris extrusa]
MGDLKIFSAQNGTIGKLNRRACRRLRRRRCRCRWYKFTFPDVAGWCRNVLAGVGTKRSLSENCAVFPDASSIMPLSKDLASLARLMGSFTV